MRRWPTLLIFVSTAITTQKIFVRNIVSNNLSYDFNELVKNGKMRYFKSNIYSLLYNYIYFISMLKHRYSLAPL